MKRAASLRTKTGGFGKLSAPNQQKRSVSPHSAKKQKKAAKSGSEDSLAIDRMDMRNRAICGHGENYATAFLHGGDRFWEHVQALKNIKRAELDRRKLALGKNTLESINWRTSLPNNLSDQFVAAFIETVRDPNFPKRREAQAKFLGHSLGSEGDLSPRRSCDICEEQRAKSKQNIIIRYEVFIECSCSYKGHSHGHACPKCGAQVYFGWESPFALG